MSEGGGFGEGVLKVEFLGDVGGVGGGLRGVRGGERHFGSGRGGGGGNGVVVVVLLFV